MDQEHGFEYEELPDGEEQDDLVFDVEEYDWEPR